MGNDLHGGAQVLAPALPVDDGFINAAAGHVAVLAQAFVNEPLVMAQIQIGLRAVVGHEHLAVLVRIHRTRIHIDVGIQLLHGDAQPPQLQQPSQRRRRNAFSQRRNHAAGDKNILRLHPEHSPRNLSVLPPSKQKTFHILDMGGPFVKGLCRGKTKK